LHITSRIKGEKYPDLLKEKGGRGFPYLAFMDAEGNVLAHPKGRSVEAFDATLSGDVPEFFDLQKKAEAEDSSKEDKAAFFMKRFALGHLDSKQMKKAIGKGSILSDEQVKQITGKLAEAKVEEILRGVNPRDEKKVGKAAKQLIALEKSDGLPPGRAGLNAWFIIMTDASQKKDAKGFERAFSAMKKGGANNPRWIKAQEERLKELQGGKK